MLTALLVIVILVFLIVTHEFGHFIMAKIFGVRVEEFGVGYPPRAFTFGRWGGTEYTLNWIPFGGFVRLFGEDAEAHGVGSFVDAKRWKQAIILVAGVVMNIIVAWLLFATALHAGVPRVVSDTLSRDPSATLMISDVVVGSPAAAAGIVAGDTITNITDENGITLSVLAPSAVSNFIKTRGGEHVTINYVHEKKPETASVVPANAVIPGAAATPALGVGLVEISTVALPWSAALTQGLTNTYNAFVTIAQSLWHLVIGAFRGAANLQDVVGPVGLVGVVGSAVQNGFGQVLALAGFIAVNLAIVNLIPIPVLDGGRLVVVALEAVTRRSVPRLAVQLLNTVGIALIILLMVTVTYHDIIHLFA